jgi:hypothetical protein
MASPLAMGAVTDEEFAALRADLAALTQRLDALATENAQLKEQAGQTAVMAQEASEKIVAVEAASAGRSWADRISIDGDFRYRYENIDVQDKDERNRSRVRARINTRAQLPGKVEVGVGLATGGDDPVSANQTIGAGGSSKNVTLNLAYADWNAAEGLSAWLVLRQCARHVARERQHGRQQQLQLGRPAWRYGQARWHDAHGWRRLLRDQDEGRPDLFRRSDRSG